MRRYSPLAAAGLALCAFVTGAQAQSSFPCDSFSKNADGSWNVLHTTYIEGPNVKVQDGAVLDPGRIILGYDIAAMIAKACPNAPVAPAQDAAAPAALPQTAVMPPSQAAPSPMPPPVASPSPLARYADANGNIDIRQLTCGHLDGASLADADLLLGWYSGWYNGRASNRAGGHGINLAHLRYSIRSVLDYCKAHREKSLTQVMELMLK